jgi:HEAT repeat protein
MSMARGTRLFLIGAVVVSAATAALVWRATSDSPPPPAAQHVDQHRRTALATAKSLLSAESVFDRFLAAGTLLEAGDRAGYQMLVEGLGSPDPIVVRAAMDTLLSVPDFCGLAQTIAEMAERPILNEALLSGIAYFSRQDALPYVRGALDSPISTVRIRALRTVARLHDVQSLSLVQDSLKTRGMMDNERANVYYALAALGEGVDLQDDIIALTRNDEASVREIAAIALGNVQTERSRQALAALVEDQSTRVRVAALGSHINVGGERSVEGLEHVITAGRRDNAMIAAAALKRIPAAIAQGIIKRVTECCELKAEVAMRLMEAWGQLGGDVGDITIPAWGLRNGDADVRLQTVWALGWRADQGGRDLVLPYLKDPDPAMRGMAAWAVARTGGPGQKTLVPSPDEEPPACPEKHRYREPPEDIKKATVAGARRDINPS